MSGGHTHGIGYTIELGEEILERLSNKETLTDICRDERMPTTRTVANWRATYPEFGKAFEPAVLEGCHAILDETLEIADSVKEDPQCRKVRIWARHELIKRKHPAFRDKVDLNHAGKVGFALTIHDEPRPKSE